MIKPPFKARTGQSGTWIEDGQGLMICEMALLLDTLEAFRVAELLATGANERIRLVAHAQEVGKRGGRPPSKKPSKAALIKRKQREKRRPRREPKTP